jgi:hypothetical protein
MTAVRMAESSSERMSKKTGWNDKAKLNPRELRCKLNRFAFTILERDLPHYDRALDPQPLD